jgi:hypothetical protein
MSFMGKISYLDVPFGKVNWNGGVTNPFSSQTDFPWGGRLQAKAHGLLMSGQEFESRIRTDQCSKLDPTDQKCVVVGTSKVTNHDGTTNQYILLLRQKSADLYERAGVGIVLDIHIDPESIGVWIA